MKNRNHKRRVKQRENKKVEKENHFFATIAKTVRHIEDTNVNLTADQKAIIDAMDNKTSTVIEVGGGPLMLSPGHTGSPWTPEKNKEFCKRVRESANW